MKEKVEKRKRIYDFFFTSCDECGVELKRQKKQVRYVCFNCKKRRQKERRKSIVKVVNLIVR